MANEVAQYSALYAVKTLNFNPEGEPLCELQLWRHAALPVEDSVHKT